MVHPVLYPLATSYSLPSHRSYIADKAKRSMAGLTKDIEDIKIQIHDGVTSAVTKQAMHVRECIEFAGDVYVFYCILRCVHCHHFAKYPNQQVM